MDLDVLKVSISYNPINQKFAKNLLSWKNSGFSIDNSVRICISDNNARESLAQYIARCPISLEKIKYIHLINLQSELRRCREMACMLPKFGENGKHKINLINHLVKLAPVGWKEKKQLVEETEAKSGEKKSSVGTKQQRLGNLIILFSSDTDEQSSLQYSTLSYNSHPVSVHRWFRKQSRHR